MVRSHEFMNGLWERYLKGGTIVSEYSTFLAEDAERSWIADADIAVLLVCQAAIETHLRYELQAPRNKTFAYLVETYGFTPELKLKTDKLRKSRNRWVHVSDPSDDEMLQNDPQKHRAELAIDATEALETMVCALCENQFV